MSDNAPQESTYFDDSLLSMSEEDFMASLDEPEQEESPEQVSEEPTEEVEDVDAPEEDEEDSEEPDTDADEDDEDPSEEDDAEDDEDSPSDDVPENGGLESEGDVSEEGGDTDAPEEDGVDYKAEYERLTAPFKASGRDIQVKSVDEAIQLMQMGVDYNKKIRALKPNLRYIKLLENHQLLDEEKLSYLIDLSQNDSAAINKLLRDSKVDPMEIDLEKDSDYKPNKRVVDDREIELDLVMEELKDSPSFPQTLQVVSKQWDTASKRVVAEAPQLLKTIDSHISSGVFAVIQAEMDRQRLFGGLEGMSDLEAYRTVGDSIQAKGGFNHLFSNQREVEKPAPSQRKVIQPNASKATDSGRNKRKRAAAPAKASVATPSKEINYLALSDEEFEKLVGTDKL